MSSKIQGLCFVTLLWIFFVGCTPSNEGLKPSLEKAPEAVKEAALSPVEEESIRKIASKVGLNCENLSKIRIDRTKVGMPELYSFMSKECRGEEPPIPKKIPAYCVDQVDTDHQPVGLAPGVTLNEKEVLKYNLERCNCPVEYVLKAQNKSPFCERTVALPSDN